MIHSRFAVIIEITVDVLNELNSGDSYPSEYVNLFFRCFLVELLLTWNFFFITVAYY